MSADTDLREQLVQNIRGGHAHATFEDVVRDFPPDRAGTRPKGCPHSAWELLEHMRLAQNDILRFSKSADYVSPKWPEGYWPQTARPADTGDWEKSVRAFRRDRKAFEALIEDPSQNLHKKFPWGDGQTLLREALLIIDHNSHHLGQLLLVRRLLGLWPK